MITNAIVAMSNPRSTTRFVRHAGSGPLLRNRFQITPISGRRTTMDPRKTAVMARLDQIPGRK